MKKQHAKPMLKPSKSIQKYPLCRLKFRNAIRIALINMTSLSLMNHFLEHKGNIFIGGFADLYQLPLLVIVLDNMAQTIGFVSRFAAFGPGKNFNAIVVFFLLAINTHGDLDRLIRRDRWKLNIDV